MVAYKIRHRSLAVVVRPIGSARLKLVWVDDTCELTSIFHHIWCARLNDIRIIDAVIFARMVDPNKC